MVPIKIEFLIAASDKKNFDVAHIKIKCPGHKTSIQLSGPSIL